MFSSLPHSYREMGRLNVITSTLIKNIIENLRAAIPCVAGSPADRPGKRDYLTAPRDSPAIIMRWPASTSSSTGTTMNTLSALSMSQGRV